MSIKFGTKQLCPGCHSIRKNGKIESDGGGYLNFYIDLDLGNIIWIGKKEYKNIVIGCACNRCGFCGDERDLNKNNVRIFLSMV